MTCTLFDIFFPRCFGHAQVVGCLASWNLRAVRIGGFAFQIDNFSTEQTQVPTGL